MIKNLDQVEQIVNRGIYLSLNDEKQSTPQKKENKIIGNQNNSVN